MLLIAGFHRTGTTIVSRLIKSTGLYNFGEVEEDVCEHPAMMHTNDLLLCLAGKKWHDLPKDPNEIEVTKPMQAYMGEFYGIIDSCHIDAFKDPRFCILLPIWQKFFEERGKHIKVVVPTRNPFDAIRSLGRIYNMYEGHAQELYEAYMLTLYKSLKNVPHIVVQMETVMQNPYLAMSPVANFLGCRPDMFDCSLVEGKRWRHRGNDYDGEYGKGKEQIRDKYKRSDKDGGDRTNNNTA